MGDSCAGQAPEPALATAEGMLAPASAEAVALRLCRKANYLALLLSHLGLDGKLDEGALLPERQHLPPPTLSPPLWSRGMCKYYSSQLEWALSWCLLVRGGRPHFVTRRDAQL